MIKKRENLERFLTLQDRETNERVEISEGMGDWNLCETFKTMMCNISSL